jgi:hypothetical protein
MKLPVLVAAGGSEATSEASERDAWSGLPVETGLMRGCTFAGFVSFRPESFTPFRITHVLDGGSSTARRESSHNYGKLLWN